MHKIKRFLILALVLFCFVSLGCAEEPSVDSTLTGSPNAQTPTDYETSLFDTSYVHQIDIRISEEDWSDLQANASEKTKYKVGIEIDGEKMEDVSFATKGNSSLMFVAADPDSIRYSFKINFGKYVKGQTFHGLKKLSLNNSFSDATYMKDYISYGLFRQSGVPAPLTSYVWLTVNGRDHGLYLAVEDMSESFLQRAYNGMQLDGKLSSRSEEQLDQEKVDASELSVISMGAAVS